MGEGSDASDVNRYKRVHSVKPLTESVRRLRVLTRSSFEQSSTDHVRPSEMARADCVDGPRPCPLVSCQFHLALDVHPKNGGLKRNFPDLEVWEMNETCALDIADRGGATLETVSDLLNIVRERVRQIEAKALAKLEALLSLETTPVHPKESETA
jgi:hypothetical protein